MHIAETLTAELSARQNLDTEKFDNVFAVADKLQSLYSAHNCGMRFRNTFKELFRKLKVHVMLIVDKFELSGEIFEKADYALLKNLMEDPDSEYAVNIVLLSCHKMFMAEKENKLSDSAQSEIVTKILRANILSDRALNFLRKQPENTSLQFEPPSKIHLKVLADSDISLFFKALKKNYDIELSAEQIDKIKYYAGRLPHVYSIFCRRVVEEKLDGQNFFDIEKIFQSNSERIIEYAENLYEDLQADGCLDKINSVVFGYKDNVATSDEELLLHRRYITKINRCGYDNYQVLSGCFTDYLHEKYLSRYFSRDIARNLLDVHKLMKDIITETFIPLDNNGWSAVMKKIFLRLGYKEFKFSNYRKASIKITKILVKVL